MSNASTLVFAPPTRVISAYLRDTAGFFADPRHGHSFRAVRPAALSPVDRSLLFFRDCALCGDRVLAFLRSSSAASARRRRSSASNVKAAASSAKAAGSRARKPSSRGSSDSICQCVACGALVHRECLSYVHRHRNCRGHESLLPQCAQGKGGPEHHLPVELVAADKGEKRNPVAVRRQQQQLYARLFGEAVGKDLDPATASLMTLSDLIEELSITAASAAPPPKKQDSIKRGNSFFTREKGSFNHRETAKSAIRMAKRVSPVLAAGGVIGALALGPAGGVIAGINMLLGGFGVEALVAGVGLTAATAAAATVTQQQKARKVKRLDEELRSGEWATSICWECKRSSSDVPSDDACRKDAELLRRFQLPQRPLKNSDSVEVEKGSDTRQHQTYPSDAEIYRFLFGLLSSPSEFLGQVNMQLCESFRQRNFARQKSLSVKTTPGQQVLRETLHDAKMYVAHMVGATVQCFPSLASTPDAMASCTLAIERIVFDDIYQIVFGEFERAFYDANDAFYDTIEEIRREQHQQQQHLLHQQQQPPGESVIAEEHAKSKFRKNGQFVLTGDLLDAEEKLVAMMQSACSPLQKLDLLCEAFRAICCFADKLHQTASNADILIPLVCAVLIESARVCGVGANRRAFVSEVAYISFFTSGGGKGVEGYVLTSFEAAIQVIAAVDVSLGPARELDLFVSDNEEEEDDDEDDEEFFDAVAAR